MGDLVDAPQIPSDTFDCAIVTQTLQFVYDVRAALATLHRILAPGGVLLATTPGITKISPVEDELFGEWWHYTGRSLKRLAEEAFGAGERRGRDVRERPHRGRLPLRPRGVGSRGGGARRPRSALRGDGRPARDQATVGVTLSCLRAGARGGSRGPACARRAGAGVPPSWRDALRACPNGAGA